VHSSFRDGDRHRHRSLPWPAHGPRRESPGGIDQSVQPHVRSLCLFDGGSLVTSAAVPAGGGCGQRACWSEAPIGFAYNNGDGSTPGTVALTLKKGSSPFLRSDGSLLKDKPD